MKNDAIVWFVILLLMVCVGLVSAQIRPPNPTPPNPAPNIPTPFVPKVTPSQPVVPTPTGPVSPATSALPETEKPLEKSQPDNGAADQDPVEYMFMALIALIILGFGILIGRMSVRPKSK